MDKVSWVITAILSVVVGITAILSVVIGIISPLDILPDYNGWKGIVPGSELKTVIWIVAVFVSIACVVISHMLSQQRHKKFDKGKFND